MTSTYLFVGMMFNVGGEGVGRGWVAFQRSEGAAQLEPNHLEERDHSAALKIDVGI